MDVRVHIIDATRDYADGLVFSNVDAIVFDAPGRIVPRVHQKRAYLLDLYADDSETTVRREYGTDTLVVTFN